MVSDSLLKYLLYDEHSLTLYFRHNHDLKIDDIQRSMQMLNHEENPYIPDHYHRLNLRHTFEGIETFSDIFTRGVSHIADEYLEIRERIVYVKADRFSEWQMLLPRFTANILVSLMIWHHLEVPVTLDNVFIKDHISPNISNTALPSPYIPQMIRFREEHKGLNDLHIHLNGTLETDIIWQEILRAPNYALKEIKNAYTEGKVKEQFMTFTSISKIDELRSLINIARILREEICNLLITGHYSKIYSDSTSFVNILSTINSSTKSSSPYSHPLASIFGNAFNPMQLETYMYIRAYDYMSSKRDDDTFARLFHYYLLILGLANRFIVHQPNAYGFEQFQKITMNGFREYSEKVYKKRFFQLSGNALKNVCTLEGRISPKPNADDLFKSVVRIYDGWSEFNKRKAALGLDPSSLSLIAHFIKKPDLVKDDYIRHKGLRDGLKAREEALISFLRRGDKYSKMLNGVDAASSELDAPPEVFAPLYRHLRAKGIKHFTYHAGEDYFHILSGLRAVYESVEFLGLQRGDRIGHACACGIDPNVWSQNVGKKILISKGEYLDDLLYAYHLIVDQNIKELMSSLSLLRQRIESLSYDIYQNYYSCETHIRAWLMRHRDPLSLFDNESSSDVAESLYRMYHSINVRNRYDETIEIPTYDIFNADDIVKLQKEMMSYLHKREIVIETLPTSNVFIGPHRSFDTLHLCKWLQWYTEGLPMPPIVIGTDDAGIFDTNIYNEYCHIFCLLHYNRGMNVTEIMKIINAFQYNAEIYCFNAGQSASE